MEEQNFRRTALSYNQKVYNIEGETFDRWQGDDQYEANNYDNDETQGNNREKQINRQRQSPYMHKNMAHKGTHQAIFYSALNPLDNYQDYEEEKYNNKLKRISGQTPHSRRNDEEIKYEDNQYKYSNKSCSDDEINPDERFSSDSENDENNKSIQNQSNIDKPRSLIQSTHLNYQQVPSIRQSDTRTKLDQKDRNISLELSPDGGLHNMNYYFSQDFNNLKTLHKYSQENPIARSQNECITSFSWPKHDDVLNDSREIIVSDDMKRNLNNVMEEDSQDEEDKFDISADDPDIFQTYDNDTNIQKQPIGGRRESFGKFKNTESDQFGNTSTPKMGEHYKQINENQNPYSREATPDKAGDDKIDLNAEKIGIRNRNFSDLITNGKINTEVLIDKIKKNQVIFEEQTENKKVFENNSNGQILSESSNLQNNSSSYLDPNVFSVTSKQPINNEMHSKNLINGLIAVSRANLRARSDEKINNSWIVSKSHANLDSKSFEYPSFREVSNSQPAFECIFEKWLALEGDIARNLKVISNKFSEISSTLNQLKYDNECINHSNSMVEKKIDSLETRLTYFSERDEEILQMSKNLSIKIKDQNKVIDDIKWEIHENKIARMSDETSRNEMLNTSMPDNKELEAIVKSLGEKIKEFDIKFTKNDEKVRWIENQMQRSTQKVYFDRRWDQMESNIKGELDKIIDQIENTKSTIKEEIAEEYIKYETIKAIDKDIKHIKISNWSISNRLDQIDKILDNGLMPENLQEDLSHIKTLNILITTLESEFKAEIDKLHATTKEATIKVIEQGNIFTALKSELDQKISHSDFQLKCHTDKIQQVEELFNEMYDVIKRHNVQDKIQNLQQINQSMLYNQKESKQDLSVSYVSKEGCSQTCEFNYKKSMIEIFR